MIKNTYERLALEAAGQGAELIIWPESAIPGWFPNEKKYNDWIKNLVVKSKADHIIGSVTMKKGKDYNAAFLINSEGEIKGEYHKQHLVPFGEYVPFAGILGKLVPYLGQLGAFQPGQGFVNFSISSTSFSPNICYEAVFPSLVRKSVQAGADVIVNLTNDGWYLNTSAPEQHYGANVFRAVELGRPVVRAANTGISAVIDPWGRELIRSPLLKRGVYMATLPIPNPSLSTPYLKRGAWFIVLAWAFVVLYTAWHVPRTKRKNKIAR